MVEVDTVANDVNDCKVKRTLHQFHFHVNGNTTRSSEARRHETLTGEDERLESDELVHVDGAVERDPPVQEGAAQARDGVPAHGHDDGRVGPHDAAGGATCRRDAVARDAPQPAVLPLHRVDCAEECHVTRGTSLFMSTAPPPFMSTAPTSGKTFILLLVSLRFIFCEFWTASQSQQRCREQQS